MNRRALIKGAAVLTAGFLLPPTLAENAEATRRYWSLDQTMLGPLPHNQGGIGWWAGQIVQIADYYPDSTTLDFSTSQIVRLGYPDEKVSDLAADGIYIDGKFYPIYNLRTQEFLP